MQEVSSAPKESVVLSTLEGSNSEAGGLNKVESVKEIASERVAEISTSVAVPSSQQDETIVSAWSFSGISSRVSGLLGAQKSKTVVIPSESVQRLQVEAAINREIRNLYKESERMMHSKHFSADKYEQIVGQIRHLRSLISNLYSLAKETLEQWYRQYVLKLGA